MKLLCITGGSAGLGAALVNLYQAQGWQVCEFSRSGQLAGHISIDLAANNAANLVDGHFSQLASQTWEEVLLINNAGMVSPLAPVATLSDEAIATNLNVNFNVAIRIIAAFIRHFGDLPARKTVLQVSSGAAIRGYGSWSLYCASKAGLEHFIRALAVEQSTMAHPVSCINFDPGVMDTAMQAEIRSRTAAEFPDVGRFIARKEQGLLRQPEDVAAAIARLVASEIQGGERYSVEEV
ncbi:SDR family NAD(P)-dependent oxidoreductase [Iodobacter arcticus]|uniref:SDR family NAD(P)-dependent oxidoreductase n=1 Tax=Iodobacter arcticus TaxID=590593 RepID=A0ABW2QUJ5_9NEIS